eukprot:IDg15578t1
MGKETDLGSGIVTLQSGHAVMLAYLKSLSRSLDKLLNPILRWKELTIFVTAEDNDAKLRNPKIATTRLGEAMQYKRSNENSLYVGEIYESVEYK